MSQETPKWMKITGIVLTVLPAFALIMSGFMKLSHNPGFVENFKKFGFAEPLLTPIGIIELLSIALYLVPRTAVLGAILVTGYLGGAIVTHLRVQDFGSIPAPLFLAVFAWGGLFLRDARLRDLLPLRKPA